MMSQNKKLDAKAIELFRLFARIEYALKDTGFHKGEGEAKANWWKFATSPEIEKMIANTSIEELTEAIQYIKDYPPQKQMINKDNKIEWAKVKPGTSSESDFILILVRRIRNNLFHGGKFNGCWFNPDRSEKLLDAALLILNHCLKVSPTTVGKAYNKAW